MFAEHAAHVLACARELAESRSAAGDDAVRLDSGPGSAGNRARTAGGNLSVTRSPRRRPRPAGAVRDADGPTNRTRHQPGPQFPTQGA